MPQDFPKAYCALKTALAEGKITGEQIDERVLKILQMKEKLQLDSQRIIPIPTSEQLHSPAAKKLKQALYQAAVSLMRDHQHLIPLLLAKNGPLHMSNSGTHPRRIT